MREQHVVSKGRDSFWIISPITRKVTGDNSPNLFNEILIEIFCLENSCVSQFGNYWIGIMNLSVCVRELFKFKNIIKKYFSVYLFCASNLNKIACRGLLEWKFAVCFGKESWIAYLHARFVRRLIFANISYLLAIIKIQEEFYWNAHVFASKCDLSC